MGAPVWWLRTTPPTRPDGGQAPGPQKRPQPGVADKAIITHAILARTSPRGRHKASDMHPHELDGRVAGISHLADVSRAGARLAPRDITCNTPPWAIESEPPPRPRPL